MPKISQLPPDAVPTTSDYVAGVQASVPGTVRFILSNLISLFWTLANIPSGNTSPITRDNESQFAFVASGLVWSGDSYNVNHNASMTTGICYINGRRISISAVTARTFTVSKDTYIDILDNGDGTGTIVYTEVTNNAASPALAANSLRIGIIITSATVIVNSGSVNQGQETIVLPIASSIAYTTTDSLGNLICPRDPTHQTLGYRIITANQAIVATSAVALPTNPLSCPVIVPTGRKIKITAYTFYFTCQTNVSHYTLWDGTPGSGTQLQDAETTGAGAGWGSFAKPELETTPATNSKTYNVGAHMSASTGTVGAASTAPAWIKVELV